MADTPHPIGTADFVALVEAVKAAVADALKPVPKLLDQVAAMKHVGLSRSAWFRAKSAGLLPKPIHIEGAGEKYRTRDLEAWVERQRPRRK